MKMMLLCCFLTVSFSLFFFFSDFVTVVLSVRFGDVSVTARDFTFYDCTAVKQLSGSMPWVTADDLSVCFAVSFWSGPLTSHLIMKCFCFFFYLFYTLVRCLSLHYFHPSPAVSCLFFSFFSLALLLLILLYKPVSQFFKCSSVICSSCQDIFTYLSSHILAFASECCRHLTPALHSLSALCPSPHMLIILLSCPPWACGHKYIILTGFVQDRSPTWDRWKTVGLILQNV